MTRPSRRGGKTGGAKANASPAKGRKTTKAKRHIAPAATRVKRRSLSDPRQDLKEAREQQAATAEILKVIASSPGDVQPVFDAVVNSAARLFEPCSAAITTLKEGKLHWNAFAQIVPKFDHEAARAVYPIPFDPDHVPSARAILERRIIAIPDTYAPDTPEFTRRISAAGGLRSMTFVPLIHENRGIGTIILTHPQTGFRFSDKQLALLQTFADQAVIAIENVRLFEAEQARTRELTEALTYQTGSANILNVIASSPTDVAPVLKAIVTSACDLCDAHDAIVLLSDGDFLRFSEHHGPIPIGFEKWPINRHWTAGRAFLDRKAVHLRDVLSDEGDDFPDSQELARQPGHRSILSVPLLRENESIGVIALRRTEVHPFSDKQIALLQTFADQAVIAIGNVRLFDEVQAKTRDLTESLEQQTATSEVLEVISSSPGELQPVFKKMLENATRVCGANFGMMQLWDGETFNTAAACNVPPAFAALREGKPIHAGPQSGLSDVLKSHEVVHIHDVTKGTAYLGGDPNVIQLADIGGARTVVLVPMLKEDEFIGTFTIYRQEVRPFTDKQIALVENFTKQAVIAIENTRLLKELRQRTDDLSKSLDDLRTAQDRLIQTEKLASLGQLTAGIAHEIKNPLNFVNNFSALSAELTDELNDVLKPITLDSKVREEVDELTGLLKDNLEKVVQHGKRADSIVKNMLLHSREGSREHRPTDINSLLDESLNLAYHGARAEKGEFNITLQRDFDADAGTIELFPQEITRAFLNLIANGVYAATKRKTEDNEPGFEPTLRATTKNFGTTVEIRIRDNGTGIPAEVQEKMFNPFFTTKPAGEGTGLGLSMTHDIIVKQHGGRIDVATEPGKFTEFTIVLPRKSNLSDKDRGKT
jgi:signal transduction histidine kinase